jgi:hypothetical protein
VIPDEATVQRRHARIGELTRALAGSGGPSLELTPAIGQEPTYPGALPGLVVRAAGVPIEVRVAAVELRPDPEGPSGIWGGWRRGGIADQPGFALTAFDRSRPGGDGPTDATHRRNTISAEEAARVIRDWLADAVAVRVEPPRPDPRTRRRMLEKILAARRADAGRATLRVDPAAERAIPGVGDRLSAGAIAWHLPRRPTTKLDPKPAIALMPLGTADRRPGTREEWLVARPFDEPDGPVVLSAGVESLISENEDHRWDREPWRWDRAAAAATDPATRWGAEPTSVASQLDALDAGSWDDALAMAGVRLEDGLRRLLDGRDASPSTRDLTAGWAPRLAEILVGTALWRLADATALLRKGRPLRIAGLGGVNIQRKPGVFLGLDGGRPSLGLEFNASNERLPEPAWARPVDLDLVRLGLLDPGGIPG